MLDFNCKLTPELWWRINQRTQNTGGCRCSTFSSSAKYCIQNSCSPSLVQNAVGVISGSCLAVTSTAAGSPSSSSSITTSISTRTKTTTSLDPPPASSDPPNGGPTSSTGSAPTRGPYWNSPNGTTTLPCALQTATGIVVSNGSNVSSCVPFQQVVNSAQELRRDGGSWHILCSIGAFLFLGWILW